MEDKKKVPVINIIIVILLIVVLGLNGFMTVKMFVSDKNETAEAVAGEVLYNSSELSELLSIIETNAYKEGNEYTLFQLKKMLSEGRGVNSALRELYADHIVYVYNSEYVFLPINEKLSKNQLKKENFYVNDGDTETYTIKYIDKENEFEAYNGVDVSKFQGDIDWELVKEDGIDFAFIRAGFRGYETGVINEDDKCRQNLENATKSGIKAGVYFFTQAVNEQEAIEEADFVIDIIKDYNIQYPVALDLEVVNDETARTKSLTKEERIKIVKAFCDTVKAAGYTPMLYGNLATMFSLVEYEEAVEYEKWFAYYDTELYFPYELGIWQYSCTGKVNGIEEACDLNLSFKDYSLEN